MKQMIGIALSAFVAVMVSACNGSSASQAPVQESFTFNNGCPQVRVAQGTLEGTLESGLKIFRGIPFAAPPVGEKPRCPYSPGPVSGRPRPSETIPCRETPSVT